MSGLSEQQYKSIMQFNISHIVLKYQALITPSSLIEYAQQMDLLATGLSNLYETSTQLVNEKHLRLLAIHPAAASDIADIICYLYQTDPALVNDNHLKLIVDNALYADEFKSALQYLYHYKYNKVKYNLINENYFLLLMKYIQHASRLALGIHALYDDHFENQKSGAVNKVDENDFKNKKYIPLLAKYVEQAAALAPSLLKLHKHELLQEINIELLVQHSEHASALTHILCLLSNANTKTSLVNDENRELLGQHAEQASHFYSALESLKASNSKLINDENFKLLIKCKYPIYLKKVLIIINNIDLFLMNNNKLQLLVENDQALSSFSNMIDLLEHHSIEVDAEYCKFLLKKIKYWAHIEGVLSMLSKTVPALINKENVKLWLEKATKDQIRDLRFILNILTTVDPVFGDETHVELLLQCMWKIPKPFSNLTPVLHFLKQANVKLINEKNVQALIAFAYVGSLYDLKEVLEKLKVIKPILVNEANLQLLLTHPEEVKNILPAFLQLACEELLDENARERILKNPEHADKIVEEIIAQKMWVARFKQ